MGAGFGECEDSGLENRVKDESFFTGDRRTGAPSGPRETVFAVGECCSEAGLLSFLHLGLISFW